MYLSHCHRAPRRRPQQLGSIAADRFRILPPAQRTRPRSKLDHETRARRQKALEAPRGEPRRTKTHWDHLLGEMAWLAKEFDAERKWKLSMAKRIAQRANKGVVDQATKDERKQKEEEVRLRKVALNISKDVFYKNQLELEERKKKALDKQLDFLLGQTERYSTMLAENLVDVRLQNQENESLQTNQRSQQELAQENINASSPTDVDNVEIDDDYNSSLGEEPEDDEHTIDEDEAQITEAERNEELAALQAEADLPLDDILKLYTKNKVSRESSPDGRDVFSDSDSKDLIKDPLNQANGCNDESDHTSSDEGISSEEADDYHSYSEFVKKNTVKCNGNISSVDAKDDEDYVANDEGKDDEATLSEEEELAKKEDRDPLDEVKLLQKESEIPLEELLARYQKDGYADDDTTELENSPALSVEDVNANMSVDDESADSVEVNRDLSADTMKLTRDQSAETLKVNNDQSAEIVEGNNDTFEDHESAGMLGPEHVSGSVVQLETSEPIVQENTVKEGDVTDAKAMANGDNSDVIADAAAAARSAQPTGNTFSTTNVRTKFPFLLKHSLREYQHIGLDWLVAMYEKRLNGILADEMGLGKTIMTISLLAHLACEKGIWGPHLIVVPTSVMLNWETEFLKWCPAFKILTYFGSAKERKQKRQGWMKPNYFHVCITTYRLVIQDSKVFKRKKWKYLILDEAHLIKNWKSQRWQTLLNFNSKRRILLTGTPLQNDLMELWSLMHFLMPHVFQSHQEFKDWFCNPISGMVEGQDKVNKEVIDRGGVGINLVGADTVIFYDSDWNPAMDQQAQDRCHRIGQTREVHIYRLISESTIEENILKKANQKRALDDLVIQRGSYNTEFFKKLDPMEFFSGHSSLHAENQQKDCSLSAGPSNGTNLALSNVDVEAAIRQAEDEADYMALKRLEQEEAVDNQEFSEEAAGRLEEDDLVNEEDTKPDEHTNEEHKYQCSDLVKDKHVALSINQLDEEKAITLAGGDGDIDMLADVKQMAAAAAAAGQASSSFENQLRPIDRYAMRFLELWDPIIDKAAINYQVNVEEEEWELERIEKLKEDLEAEIDEDQEPLSYESWDVDFATTAYRQHVEALAQKQLLEEQERQAREAAKELEEKNDNSTQRKKSKKNKKKAAKFKSLKKGRLSSESEVMVEETSVDTMSIDDNAPSPELMSDESAHHYSNKRKRIMSTNEEENSNSRSLKKLKKAPKSSFSSEALSPKHFLEGKQLKLKDELNDSDPKSGTRIKSDGRISIPCMPVKRVMVIKPERLKKKSLWSRDCASDSWTIEEDAVLCATVNEYGPLWELASDSLHSVPCGALYRGRYRHPVHCCERFRELVCKHILSATDNSNSEKVPSGTGKAILKVSEDQTQMLLNVISELPNNELLLQKHFMAVLSSVWRSKSARESHCIMSYSNTLQKPGRLSENWSMTNFRPNFNLVRTALADAQVQCPRMVVPTSNHESRRNFLELELDFLTDQHDNEANFPSVVNVSILEPEPLKHAVEPVEHSLLSTLSYRHAENRFRIVSETCFEGEGSHWASSAFHTYDAGRHKSGPKSIGKHKASSESGRPPKSKIQRTNEPQEVPVTNNFHRIPGQLLHNSAEFHITQSLSDLGISDSEFTYFDNLPQEAETEFVPYQYDSDVLSGIEELDPLTDFTDIG
uniref:Protein PHOTOPERIOD-INDEPENDENT EARLY FLOWERING 1 n=1 Tax=Oryza meridionalis TaxID=40149 RepID=A0A0E0CQ01_9ORYZ